MEKHGDSRVLTSNSILSRSADSRHRIVYTDSMHKVLPLARPAPFTLPHLYTLSIDTSIQAGFPSLAEDHFTKRIDVLEKLIRHPQATYQMRVKGDSMRDEIRQTSLIPSNSTITHCGIPGPISTKTGAKQ